MSSSNATLPIAVIGAGPIGLAAAAHLLARGETPLVFEAGATVGASIRAWGHVRLFSPWRYLIDTQSAGLLEPTGWTAPEPEALPLGRELVEQYLEPLAAHPAIRPALRLGAEVIAISRQAHDKLKDADRAEAPFVLRVRSANGLEEDVLARAVIDASGTWRSPNPLGANGLPALSEGAARERVAYGIPDVLGRDRARYAGKRVLVVGSGHSAFNALLDLAQLAREARGTAITWVIRKRGPGQLFGGGSDDALPARGALGTRAEQLVASGAVQLISLRIARVEITADGLVVIGEDGTRLDSVDEIIGATGFRPDLELTRELRLGLDPATEAPTALAPLIDPNVHSCGTVSPHGVDELSHPDPGYYTVGIKSYGRAPTFLLLTGYEQVRSVVAGLVGDWEAARQVELVLPETGVCSGGGAPEEGASCGSSTPTPPPAARVLEPELLPVIQALPVIQVPSLPAPELAVVGTSTVQALGVAESNSCCSTAEQATCCEPSEKASCCGGSSAAHSSGCGCR